MTDVSMSSKGNRFSIRFGFAILIGLSIVFVVFYRNIFSENSFPIHYTEKVSPEIYKDVHFYEASSEYGLSFVHRSEETRFAGSISQSPPTVSVVDLNNDNFQDVIISGGLRPFVFLNDHGTRFIQQSENSFGFDSPGNSPAGFTAFADVNGDGVTDAVVGGRPDTRLYYGKKLKDGRIGF